MSALQITILVLLAVVIVIAIIRKFYSNIRIPAGATTAMTRCYTWVKTHKLATIVTILILFFVVTPIIVWIFTPEVPAAPVTIVEKPLLPSHWTVQKYQVCFGKVTLARVPRSTQEVKIRVLSPVDGTVWVKRPGSKPVIAGFGHEHDVWPKTYGGGGDKTGLWQHWPITTNDDRNAIVELSWR